MFTTNNLKKLNDLEMDIYEYVITNKEIVPSMRIRDLAKAVNVSTTTILRFCNKLGCSGFTEFKIKLQLELETGNTVNVQSDIQLTIANLERLAVSGIDEKILEASEILSAAKNIVFLGMGSSAILCKYAVRSLFSFGIIASYVDDPYYPLNVDFPEETVFIIVSVSGDTPDVVQFINNFKKKHGKVISITNYTNNTISRLSDLNISYYVHPEFIGMSNITTQVSVIYILESLAKNTYKLKIR
ncbi:DNA-binding MurR/RpiR family transcriptional regulator [Enterococcus sp. PF1-24]|uniref:MurR/RpiR family transcriptional regulator n=1 Tax=unclassified Enterococcus TaxID=2608891 RepID=UPI0024743C9A|nr:MULTISPECIES: MurR/RpiR family transcriptional regulator [unclassified Enterococcus]MDH6365393.1 DNA-binding MurR/RpiR family transcriptional regulator [Enterococcus sp. PFB1-1]MDH6402494.1 DNA-binding MurR/RpiR family transcriptional regulator [Enterococcus sp. PF1-24]